MMKTLPALLLPFCLMIALLNVAGAQNTKPNPEKVWKDLSRLSQNLRDDLKKAPWWKCSSLNQSTSRLDSTIKFSRVNVDQLIPLNKTKFEYQDDNSIVMSDYVNFGQWVLQKRTTVVRDARSRITGVTEEEPGPNGSDFQWSNKLSFYYHGDSDAQCDSILSSHWDESSQQWAPAYRLAYTFNAQNHEAVTETNRYDEGFQTISVREENEFDDHGNPYLIHQYLMKDGKWEHLGNVNSTFDKDGRETIRIEAITIGPEKFVPIRRLNRTFDLKGGMSEQRFKFNTAGNKWDPLKTITKGKDETNGQDWVVTETFRPGSSFKNKVETFWRPQEMQPGREVHSTYQSDAKKWRITAETRYYYAH
jgi:hypothetical protein